MTETSTTGTSSGTVVVLVDHQRGTVRAPALELLTAARALGAVEAVWVGEGLQDALPALGRHGASVVHHVTPDQDAALTAVVAHVLAGVADACSADTVLVSSTFENKEVAALLARRLDASLVVDATGVERRADGRLETTQLAFTATWVLRSATRRPRAVVAMKANAVAAEPLEGPGLPEVRQHVPAGDLDLRGLRVVERTERPESGRPGLAEAQVVVAGGRGTEGDFSAVEELADVLGAAVGATRVATDEGWIGHEAQIGQTGVTVTPVLYVGAGVSGAVHHRGGMQSSGTIVAVNSDPEAPIFEIADFGVVGDLFTVLPQAAAELRRLREAAS